MQRLGVLRSADAGDPEGKAQLFAFTEELAALGWADGPNLRMEIAKELVALQPDVILAQGTPVTAALQRETRTIPIVFATVLAKRRAETYDCLETC
jgi:putative ABC transport system substrate-binding protein